jgi:hypothetical protein
MHCDRAKLLGRSISAEITSPTTCEAGMISQLRRKTKGLKQIQNAPKGFVLKDDIEQGYRT